MTRRTGLVQRLGVGDDQLGRLVRDGRDVLVVDDLDDVPLSTLRLDLIGDRSGLGKSRDIPSDLVEGDDEIIGPGPGQLGLGLVSEDGDTGFRVGVQGSKGGLGHGRVDTTAQASVRGDGNVENLGIAVVRTDLRVLEELYAPRA